MLLYWKFNCFGSLEGNFVITLSHMHVQFCTSYH